MSNGKMGVKEQEAKRQGLMTKPAEASQKPEPAAQKGFSGRPKGSVNRTTRVLKEAILLAGESVGRDGKGTDGLVGYLANIAVAEPKLYFELLKLLLPHTLSGPEGGPVRVALSVDDIDSQLRENGILIDAVYPPPPMKVVEEAHETNGRARNGN